jgi:hypothetical protein
MRNAGNASDHDSISGSPLMSVFGFEQTPPLNSSSPHGASTPQNITFEHSRSRSNSSTPKSEQHTIDPGWNRLNRSESHPIGSAGPFDQTQHLQDAKRPLRSAPHAYILSSNFFNSVPSPAGHGDFKQGGTRFVPNSADIRHSSPSMPPPRLAEDRPFKRRKPEHSTGSPSVNNSDANTPNTDPPTPYSPFLPPPLTPNSLLGTDDAPPTDGTRQDELVYLPSDPRRLSVQSLINGPQAHNGIPGIERGRQYPIADSKYTTYGYDLGLPDYDSPRNNDHAAIAVFSPPSDTLNLEHYIPFGSVKPHSKVFVFEKRGYYVKPVPIRIPRLLEPLPPLLQENPMNLLYFHHFVNCTARVLVPHDCEGNPFRYVLPQSELAVTLYCLIC